jgi:hypothetical protein
LLLGHGALVILHLYSFPLLDLLTILVAYLIGLTAGGSAAHAGAAISATAAHAAHATTTTTTATA